MTWLKKQINQDDIPAIAEQGMIMAKAGNPLVEQLRCVYTLEDNKIIYMIPLLDYIDNPPENITKFYLCQMAS